MPEENTNLPVTIESVIQKSGIDTEQAAMIRSQFTEFIKQIDEWKDKAFKINITSPDQVFEIGEAKRAWTVVKNLRLSTEERRKNLKEDSLRKGKLIDGLARFVFDMIEPIEDHLEKQAKWVEQEEKRAQEQLLSERKELLSKYVEDLSPYNLSALSQDGFDALLADRKEAWEKKEAERIAAEKVEADRKEAERIENERIREENTKLKESQDIKDAELLKEKKAREALEKAEQDRKDADAKAKQEADQKAEQDKLAKEKAERDAKNAPDKEKLTIYADSIKNLVAPTDISKAALEIVAIAEAELLKVSQKIKDSIKVL